MKSHASHSFRIVSELDGLEPISVDIIGKHHERMDGCGYPNQIGAEGLSRYARMITMVDVYDAITADRVYKDSVLPIATLRIMMAGSGRQFDPELLQRFIKCMGVHPVGTLVKLQSGKLGLVVRSNRLDPLKPVVKVFYNTRSRHHVDVKELDLSGRYCTDAIENAVKPEEFKIDMLKFFQQSIL